MFLLLFFAPFFIGGFKYFKWLHLIYFSIFLYLAHFPILCIIRNILYMAIIEIRLITIKFTAFLIIAFTFNLYTLKPINKYVTIMHKFLLILPYHYF